MMNEDAKADDAGTDFKGELLLKGCGHFTDSETQLFGRKFGKDTMICELSNRLPVTVPPVKEMRGTWG